MLIYSLWPLGILQMLSPLFFWHNFSPAGKGSGLWPLQRRSVPACCSSIIFFSSYMCICMKVGLSLTSRTQKWFLSMPQYCLSPGILFNWWWAIVFIGITCLSWILFLCCSPFNYYYYCISFLLLNCFYLNVWVFSLLHFQFSSPHPPGEGTEQAAVWYLVVSWD